MPAEAARVISPEMTAHIWGSYPASQSRIR
jgi:hypothetical protein